MQNCRITAAASYAPQQVITNNDLAARMETSDEWISSRTGIRQRHISSGENTSDLCAEVMNQLLEKSGNNAEDIDLLIVATYTPDYLTPSTACIVQKKCDIKNAFCFDINAACSGFVYALSVAHKYIASGMYKRAAVIGGEICSKSVDWNDRATCVLFGDGAGGVILEASEQQGYLAEELRSDGNNFEGLTGVCIPPSNLFNGIKREFDYIRMDGRAIYDFAVHKVPESIRALTGKAGITPADLDLFVPHQANGRFFPVFAKKLGMDSSKIFKNIDKYGNTSAASVPIALADALEQGIISLGSGQKVALCGFGSGLTWGSILLSL